MRPRYWLLACCPVSLRAYSAAGFAASASLASRRAPLHSARASASASSAAARHGSGATPQLRVATAPPPLVLAPSVVDGLDADQRRAVEAPLGIVTCVSAGPGSGKTRVLTRRIEALCAQPGVCARQVLALSFTRKAADELRTRLGELLGDARAGELRAGTFHSWCQHALSHGLALDDVEWRSLAVGRLRELHDLDADAPLPADLQRASRGLGARFSVYDSDDSLRLLKALVPPLKNETKLDATVFMLVNCDPHFGATPAQLAKELSRVKSHGGADAAATPWLSRVLAAYETALLERNALDYDDLLLYALRALLDLPRAAARARALWPHVLVDEWQDTNGVQYDLIRALAAPLRDPATAPAHSLFVVGDADQSIYGFRGAVFENLERLPADFPGARQFSLPNNYRSTDAIARVASSIIGRAGATRAAARPPSALAAAGGGEGLPAATAAQRVVTVVATSCSTGQADYVARTAAALTDPTRRGGLALREVAILARTNRELQALEPALLKRQLPYVIAGGTALFSRVAVKGALAHVRLVLGAGEFGALERVAEAKPRGLGPRSLDEFERWLSGLADAADAAAAEAPSARDLLLALAPAHALDELRAVEPDLDLASLAALRAGCTILAGKRATFGALGAEVAAARAAAYRVHSLGAAIEAVLDACGLRAHAAALDERDAERFKASAGAQRADAVNASGVLGTDGTEDAVEIAGERTELLERLLAIVAESPLSASEDDVLAFLATAALDGGETAADGARDAIRLSTVHRSKGLEFECVLLTGCEDETLPSFQAVQAGPRAIAEEQRLMYVGATRAKSRLYLVHRKAVLIVHAGGAFTKATRVSRFLDEARSPSAAHGGDALKGSVAFKATTGRDEPPPPARPAGPPAKAPKAVDWAGVPRAPASGERAREHGARSLSTTGPGRRDDDADAEADRWLSGGATARAPAPAAAAAAARGRPNAADARDARKPGRPPPPSKPKRPAGSILS